MSEVKVDTISERTAAGGVTIDGVLIKDGVATFQTAAGSPLVFEGATADAFETTFAITDPTADRVITFPDESITLGASGVNTPCWLVGMDADQAVSDGVQTIAELDDVEFNVGFTWDTVNFKGVPGTAGKYLISTFAEMSDGGAGTNLDVGIVSLFVNTVETGAWGIEMTTRGNNWRVGGSVILDLGATDYLQMKCYIEVSSTTPYIRQETATLRTTYMSGMKLIEA